MRITQRQIARIADVSQATVSRVLSGDLKVDAESRDRVLEAIRAHNYQPDVRARSLRSKHTHLIGLVVKRPEHGLNDDPFFASLIAEITDYLSKTEYHLCVDIAHSEARHAVLYDELLRSRRVDGLILVESQTQDKRVQKLQADEFPFVLIGNPGPEGKIHSVDNDNVLAARLATEHLIQAGYDRIGMLAGPRGVTVSDDRVAGYIQAIESHHEPLVWNSEFGLSAAADSAQSLLRASTAPNALVVLDDFMAMGVAQIAQSMRIRIPEDLGLVSFNDTMLCGLVEGGLSSVSLNITEIVREACDLLLAAIQSSEPIAPKRTIVPCRLHIRGSSLRPREVVLR